MASDEEDLPAPAEDRSPRRLGEVTLSKPLRSMADRVPVEIPDDMDTAIGLDELEQLGDRPLRKEMEARYEANLSRITRELSTTNDISSEQTQVVAWALGWSKRKTRNEQQELYRRVAEHAIKEQQGNTRMRKHFQDNMQEC